MRHALSHAFYTKDGASTASLSSNRIRLSITETVADATARLRTRFRCSVQPNLKIRYRNMANVNGCFYALLTSTVRIVQEVLPMGAMPIFIPSLFSTRGGQAVWPTRPCPGRPAAVAVANQRCHVGSGNWPCLAIRFFKEAASGGSRSAKFAMFRCKVSINHPHYFGLFFGVWQHSLSRTYCSPQFGIDPKPGM